MVKQNLTVIESQAKKGKDYVKQIQKTRDQKIEMIKQLYSKIRETLEEKEKKFLDDFGNYCDKQILQVESNLKECTGLMGTLQGLTDELGKLKNELCKKF